VPTEESASPSWGRIGGEAMTEGIDWLVLGHWPAGAELSPRGPGPRLWLLPDALEFGILGQVEVLRGGQRLALGGHRQLAVLAVLVMDVGRVVSVDRLVEALWEDIPPTGARSTVHAYVSKLRRVLEPDRPPGLECSLLATRGRGYVLEVDPAAVDGRRFELLAAEGRTALVAGRPQVAAGLFAQALAMWRGPALADFASESFAVAETARLEELRLSVTEDQMEATLALGRHWELVSDLERLVAAHPFRERLRAQLMVALYRSGRQAEALRAYQAGRRLLAEELGIDPGPGLKTLENAMLRQDPSLDWVAPGPKPPAGAAENQGRLPVTLLCSEIQGLTGLRTQHPGRAALVVGRHEDIVTQVVVDYGGRLSDGGPEDSLVAVFPGAEGALSAAVALQRVLAAQPWPEGVRVEVRIGLRTQGAAAGSSKARRRKPPRARSAARRELVVA
jgi:DNA-binding SARP family transcriptional activator